MKLSVIIVNYNVKYFLEQCLYSVQNAIKGIEAEVFVVDNNSVDGSVSLLLEKFSWVKTIANKDNRGFSKANNQAIKIATGEYILLLNPDTVVESDTFRKAIDFMDSHTDCGGLGVKMLDGKGKFLPESKRGLPTPLVAFYKIAGLSKVFPKSKTFGKYHLGYLNQEAIHEVDVLSGAFMLLRKVVLDKIGYLDEEYFMYGEDIDLSYRIQKAGYKNYYFPETRIIHYKGESTKKSSINYVFVFYRAMVIFANKHFSKTNAQTFSILINIAIYFRAFAAIANRFIKQILLPLVDAAAIFGGMYLIKQYWEYFVKSSESGYYPITFLILIIPLYILIWLISVFLSGGYDRPVKIINVVKGVFLGTIFILVVYALLPDSYRFSRGLIVVGTIWAIMVMTITRYFSHFIKQGNLKLGAENQKRFVVVGEKEEAERVSALLKQTDATPSFIGLINPKENNYTTGIEYIGTVDHLAEVIEIYKIDEVIFCAKDISAQRIIDIMSDLQQFQIDFKIAPPESLYIIGANSIHTSGDIYILDINSITKAENKRNKRLLDIASSLVFLTFCIPLLFFIKTPINFIINIFSVLFGYKSWVGYSLAEEKITNPRSETYKLPKIKKGVLNPIDSIKKNHVSTDTIHKLNILYSRDYKPSVDIIILYKGLKNLGRKG